MKRYVFILILSILTLPQLVLSVVTPPGDMKVERNNLLPQSHLAVIFDSQTTGFTNNTSTGSSYGLGDVKIRCHTWTIANDKTSTDVTWGITLQGSLDDVDYETLDSTTTVSDFWKRDVENRGANWIRAHVWRNYTGSAPTITIKHQAGCN